MGTVGLSFGSPTSGQGFDVAATVKSLVSNLQNVETPWKNQLTALQAQDTALSNIGTLLSALSTGASKLTNFTGVMAQKTGSSSNTNVVQLSSATSSAVAGTHTIAISNLAQTSSGYLSPITNAADKLAGSIDITVGSKGTKHTISIGSSSNTLAGLASAINQAGIGVIASVLTDSSGSRLSLVSTSSGAKGEVTVNPSITDTSNLNAGLTYTKAVTGLDANLTVDGADLTSASNTVTNLIPGVTFQMLSASALDSNSKPMPVQVVIGNDNSGVETAISQMVTDYNALVKAITTQEGTDSTGKAEPLFGSPTLSLMQQQLMGALNAQNPNGTLDTVQSLGTVLTGSITLQAGSGQAQTIQVPASDQTLNGLVSAINSANMGLGASITTLNGQSTLSLMSRTAGPAGSLSVQSNLTAATPQPLTFTGTSSSAGVNAHGVLDAIPSSSDTLSGSISIQVGSGSLQTISVDPGNRTLSGLSDAINLANLGVTASVETNSNGWSYLSFQSGTSGSEGNLMVVSSILDTTQTTSTALNYNNSSDISTLANLGITLSTNYDGTLQFDAATLDAAINSDYSSVQGFFQNINSWGRNLVTTLANAGTSNTSTIKLAQKANTSMESALNAQIKKEDALIAAQEKALTLELNTANQILQGLPSQLSGVNEIYAAISGYNTRA